MLDSIKNLLDSFKKNNIIYCHWKSSEHLNEALNGDTDLDILFDYKQRNLIEIVLNSCGLKRFRSTSLMQYNAIEDYIGFDENTGKIFHLHLHWRLTIGEKHLKGYTLNTWNQIVLSNRVFDEELGIYRSLYELELILLLIRLALKNRLRDVLSHICENDLKEYNWLLERINREKFLQICNSLFSNDVKISLLVLSNGDLSEKRHLYNLQKYIKKEFNQFTGFSNCSSRYLRFKREIFWLFGGILNKFGNNYNPYRRMSPVGGLVVSILGSDGAGKSTAIKNVKKEFSKKIDVVSIYFGSGNGSSSLWRFPMKLVAKKVGGKGVGHKVDKDIETENSNFKTKIYIFCKLLWATSLALEKKNKLKLMTKARNNGMLVLTDRYPQSDVSGYSDGPLLEKYAKINTFYEKLYKWELNIYKSAKINPPDLCIKLMVDSQIALERKPEMTIEEIENKKNVISNLNISEHSLLIDTSCEEYETYKKIMSAIWNLI